MHVCGICLFNDIGKKSTHLPDKLSTEDCPFLEASLVVYQPQRDSQTESIVYRKAHGRLGSALPQVD